MHRLQDLVRLHRQKTGAREAARLLQMGPNTERKYREALEAAELLQGDPEEIPPLEVLKAAVKQALPSVPLPEHQTSSLGAYGVLVEEWAKKGLNPRAIFDRLRLSDKDFAGSYSAVKRLYKKLKKARGVQPEDVAIPVETEPGEIAQVDFGYVGKLYDPESKVLRKAWCFVMVLGYSRHMVVRVVFDQKTETWIRLHVEAFAEFGGVPKTVVPDNLKAAVIRAAFTVDDQSELNRSYREMARHYGFKVDPTPPRDPAKKGKVEAGVKYVKGNFFVGRAESSVEEVRNELPKWVYQIAGQRQHGTTNERPVEQFEQVERARLMPLPQSPWEPIVWRRAKVHRDAHIAVEKRLYSVPWEHIGQQVWAQVSRHTVTIYAQDQRVATHERKGAGYRSTVSGHLPDHRGELRHRSRTYWESRADAIDEAVGQYVRALFDADDVLSQLRTVQAVVTHLETFPVQRATAACRRAMYFGSYGYSVLKNILRQGLDMQPLPTPSSSALPAPRFARPATQWRN